VIAESRVPDAESRISTGATTMMINLTTGETIAQQIVRCDTFWKRGRGLMLRRKKAVEEGRVFLFVERRESVAQATIHMLFVFFPIAVVWLDAHKQVVDKALARPFRPYYAPRQPAQYYVEGHPTLLGQVSPGDRLEFTSQETVP
jgi:uncharacterized membrane protein (UPF0127 family)